MPILTNSYAMTLPREYGYVLLTATTSFVVGIWHAVRVGSFRKAAGVFAPIPYALHNTSKEAISSDPKAKAEYLFNCAQRAHANFIEQYPIFLPALLIAGTWAPITASVMGMGFCVSRVIYAIGYTRTDRIDGSGRSAGGAFFLFEFALVGMCGWMGIQMVRGA